MAALELKCGNCDRWMGRLSASDTGELTAPPCHRCGQQETFSISTSGGASALRSKVLKAARR